jgi:hypothetical protein
MITPMTIAEVLELPAAVDIATAGRVFGLGRGKSFELARAGKFPCPVLTLGNQYRVTNADILKALGLNTEEQAAIPAGPDQSTAPGKAQHADPAAPVGAYVIVAVSVAAAQLPEVLSGLLAQTSAIGTSQKTSLSPRREDAFGTDGRSAKSSAGTRTR